MRNGATTIHSWDIQETTERQKHICYLLLRNRRKSDYGLLDGNPLSTKHFQVLDATIKEEELEQLVKLQILKRVSYLYEIVNETAETEEEQLLLLSLRDGDTLNYDNATKSCKYALAAGPVLLIGGWEARDEWPSGSFYTKRHPRTIVGTSSDGWVYLVVIDGRAPGEADGATIHEAALIARLLGIEDAINLDGGGSSTLWTKSDGVVSYPCDNRQYDHLGQRKVPNVVIIR